MKHVEPKERSQQLQQRASVKHRGHHSRTARPVKRHSNSIQSDGLTDLAWSEDRLGAVICPCCTRFRSLGLSSSSSSSSSSSASSISFFFFSFSFFYSVDFLPGLLTKISTGKTKSGHSAFSSFVFLTLGQFWLGRGLPPQEHDRLVVAWRANFFYIHLKKHI